MIPRPEPGELRFFFIMLAISAVFFIIVFAIKTNRHTLTKTAVTKSLNVCTWQRASCASELMMISGRSVNLDTCKYQDSLFTVPEGSMIVSRETRVVVHDGERYLISGEPEK